MSSSFTRQPRASRPCGRLRGLSVLVTGVPLMTMVAGLPVPAPATPLASVAATVQETTVLRPDGDVASFRVGNATSASAALDDPISTRTGVPDDQNMTPRAPGSSTMVALANPKLGRVQ